MDMNVCNNIINEYTSESYFSWIGIFKEKYGI